jgi:hypothetical protein
MLARISPRPADTTHEAEQVQVALLRTTSVARRIQIALGLSASIIGAARRGLARADPTASTRDLDLRFARLHFGAEVAEELRRDLNRRDTRRRPGA